YAVRRHSPSAYRHKRCRGRCHFGVVVVWKRGAATLSPTHLPVAILNWFRSRMRSALRLRLGSLVMLLALGWPMILPGILSLVPGYVEFEVNSLPALVWVWFPSGAMLAAGVLLLLIPWAREWRVPFRYVAAAVALIVFGSLRVAYEHGVDLAARTILTG